MELGLVRLTELANTDQLLFWGRVETLTKPYYIAMSVDYEGYYEFPHKKFYWRFISNNLVREIVILQRCPHFLQSTEINSTPSTSCR